MGAAGRPLLAYPLLTIGYVISGKLSMLLAVQPGYASPIFPPAGIAMAAMLIWGWATLPWVFLGAFLLNFWIGSALDRELYQTVAAAAGIGAASVLQAAIGGTGLRRAVGNPAALDTGRAVARFLLVSPKLPRENRAALPLAASRARLNSRGDSHIRGNSGFPAVALIGQRRL